MWGGGAARAVGGGGTGAEQQPRARRGREGEREGVKIGGAKRDPALPPDAPTPPPPQGCPRAPPIYPRRPPQGHDGHPRGCRRCPRPRRCPRRRRRQRWRRSGDDTVGYLARVARRHGGCSPIPALGAAPRRQPPASPPLRCSTPRPHLTRLPTARRHGPPQPPPPRGTHALCATPPASQL